MKIIKGLKSSLILFLIIISALFINVIPSFATTYTSQYPPAQSYTYVKATSFYNSSYVPYFATDPTKPLIGEDVGNIWQSALNANTSQRFHIDLGSAKVIRRIYYENEHHLGMYTEYGVKIEMTGSGLEI